MKNGPIRKSSKKKTEPIFSASPKYKKERKRNSLRVSWPFTGLSSLTGSLLELRSATGRTIATPRKLFGRSLTLPTNEGSNDNEHFVKAERARGCDLTENIAAFNKTQIEYHRNALRIAEQLDSKLKHYQNNVRDRRELHLLHLYDT